MARKDFLSKTACWMVAIGGLFMVMGTGYPQFALAQRRIEIPSSPNPVGSGARALGMGGAFIAVADDATAASWNPAGLDQLDLPEISMVGDVRHRIEDNTFGVSPGASGAETVTLSELNYLSAAYPFNLWGRNMVVSLNRQHLYDFKRKWDFTLSEDAMDLATTQQIHYRQEGSLSAVGLAWAMRFSRRLSFGLTLNFWDDDLSENRWEQETVSKGIVTTGGGAPSEFGMRALDRYSFSGVNANLGIIWRVIEEKLTLGAVLKTPFEGDITHRHTSITQQPGGQVVNPRWYEEDSSLDMPMSIGIGAAYRFSDALTASLDLYRTEWDDFVLTSGQGEKTSPFTGRSPGESDIDPTHQIRMGAEYLIIQPQYVVPIRGGLFYDPAPAEGGTDDIYGFSLGTGMVKEFKEEKAVGMRGVAVDVAYQYRFGDGLGASILKAWGFSQDLEEHTLISSVIIYF